MLSRMMSTAKLPINLILEIISMIINFFKKKESSDEI